MGNVQFKKISRELKQKIIEELGNAVECKIKYDRRWKEYVFQDVNWASHVSGEDIAKVVEKYKKHLKYIAVSVFYLNEPHENIVLEDGELKAEFI